MKMFTGKAALVTGGSRGIGLAIARALLERGAQVAIMATSDATLRSGAMALKKCQMPWPSYQSVPMCGVMTRWNRRSIRRSGISVALMCS